MNRFTKKWIPLIVLFFGVFLIFGSVFGNHQGRLSSVSDKISTSRPDVGASHEVSFTIRNNVPPSGKIVIDFLNKEDSTFYTPGGLDYEDVDFLVNGEEMNLEEAPGPETSGLEVDSGEDSLITITLADDLSLESGDEVLIKVGTGGAQIINPPVTGTYRIEIETLDDEDSPLDFGIALIAIVRPVEVGTEVIVLEPRIITEPASVLSTDTAILYGELINMGLEDSVDIFFQYRLAEEGEGGGDGEGEEGTEEDVEMEEMETLNENGEEDGDEDGEEENGDENGEENGEEENGEEEGDEYDGDDDWFETSKFGTTRVVRFSEILSGLQRGATYEFRAAVEWYDEEEDALLVNYGEILEFKMFEDEPGEGGDGDGDGGEGDGDGDGEGEGEGDGEGEGEEDGEGDGPEDEPGDGHGPEDEPGDGDGGSGGGTGGGTGGSVGGGTGGGDAGGDRGPEPGGEPANPPPPEREDPPPYLSVQGWAYPGGELSLFKGDELLQTVEAADDGSFLIEKNEPMENENFNFLLEGFDDEERPSTETTFNLTPSPDTGYWISGHILSPTIELSRSSVTPEDEFSIFGKSVPGGEVEVRFFEDMEEVYLMTTEVAEDGSWEISPDVDELDQGRYEVIARTEAHRGDSAFTAPVNLSISEDSCVAADINGDGSVDLMDFSIMMSVWGTDDPGADLNNDGVVDLVDFSILLSCWTG